MKKKFLTIFMALLIVFPLVFGLSACKDNDESYTNQELSVIYKDVAVSTWQSLGVNDPTAVQSASITPLNANFVDKKVETTVESEIKNIKLNANSMAGVIYFISLLYSNPNFVPTNNIASFSANITVGSQTMTQNMVLETSISKTAKKLNIVAATTVGNSTQYCFGDVDYDFDTNTLIAFRYTACVGTAYVDMALTAEGKYVWYETETADDFTASFDAEKQAFIDRSSNVSKLATTFDNELQTYMNILQDTIAQLNQ